jgi:hypothetical protein
VLHAASPEVWVDASVTAGGDGGSAAPFKTLGEALALAPARVHLRAGLYRGPFSLSGPLSLVGHGEVVLFAEGAQTVLEASQPVTMERLTLQGGARGAHLSAGGVFLNVEVSGSREEAVVVSGGKLTLTDAALRASFPEARGLVLEPSASAECTRCRFAGPFRRGIDAASGATLSVEDSRFEGPTTGIQLAGATARVERTELNGGRAPALFVSGGRLTVRDVRVLEHEYGLVARDAADVDAKGLTVVRAQRAGVAIIGAHAVLDDFRASDAGSFGGLQMVGGDVTVRRFWIHAPDAYGVTARQGKLTLEEGEITGVTNREGGAGNGLELRGIQASLRGLNVSEVAGVGLIAAEGAHVRVRDSRFERCGVAGVESDTLASLRLDSCRVRSVKGPALLVPGKAVLEADVLEVSGVQALAWGECDAGAVITLSRLHSDAALTPSPCVLTPGSKE